VGVSLTKAGKIAPVQRPTLGLIESPSAIQKEWESFESLYPVPVGLRPGVCVGVAWGNPMSGV
jgi:hypothetical protein